MVHDATFTAYNDQANAFLDTFVGTAKATIVETGSSARAVSRLAKRFQDSPHTRDGMTVLLAAALVRLAEQDRR